MPRFLKSSSNLSLFQAHQFLKFRGLIASQLLTSALALMILSCGSSSTDQLDELEGDAPDKKVVEPKKFEIVTEPPPPETKNIINEITGDNKNAKIEETFLTASQFQKSLTDLWIVDMDTYWDRLPDGAIDRSEILINDMEECGFSFFGPECFDNKTKFIAVTLNAATFTVEGESSYFFTTAEYSAIAEPTLEPEDDNPYPIEPVPGQKIDKNEEDEIEYKNFAYVYKYAGEGEGISFANVMYIFSVTNPDYSHDAELVVKEDAGALLAKIVYQPLSEELVKQVLAEPKNARQIASLGNWILYNRSVLDLESLKNYNKTFRELLIEPLDIVNEESRGDIISQYLYILRTLFDDDYPNYLVTLSDFVENSERTLGQLAALALLEAGYKGERLYERLSQAYKNRDSETLKRVLSFVDKNEIEVSSKDLVNILKHLSNPNRVVSRSVYNIAMRGDLNQEHFDVITPILNDKKSSEEVKNYAIDLLTNDPEKLREDNSLDDALLSNLSHPLPSIREKVYSQILNVQFKEDQIPQILPHIKSDYFKSQDVAIQLLDGVSGSLAIQEQIKHFSLDKGGLTQEQFAELGVFEEETLKELSNDKSLKYDEILKELESRKHAKKLEFGAPNSETLRFKLLDMIAAKWKKKLYSEDYVPFLIDQLASQYPDVRLNSGYFLSFTMNKEAVSALINSIDDPVDQVLDSHLKVLNETDSEHFKVVHINLLIPLTDLKNPTQPTSAQKARTLKIKRQAKLLFRKIKHNDSTKQMLSFMSRDFSKKEEDAEVRDLLIAELNTRTIGDDLLNNTAVLLTSIFDNVFEAALSYVKNMNTDKAINKLVDYFNANEKDRRDKVYSVFDEYYPGKGKDIPDDKDVARIMGEDIGRTMHIDVIERNLAYLKSMKGVNGTYGLVKAMYVDKSDPDETYLKEIIAELDSRPVSSFETSDSTFALGKVIYHSDEYDSATGRAIRMPQAKKAARMKAVSLLNNIKSKEATKLLIEKAKEVRSTPEEIAETLLAVLKNREIVVNDDYTLHRDAYADYFYKNISDEHSILAADKLTKIPDVEHALIGVLKYLGKCESDAAREKAIAFVRANAGLISEKVIAALSIFINSYLLQSDYVEVPMMTLEIFENITHSHKQIYDKLTFFKRAQDNLKPDSKFKADPKVLEKVEKLIEILADKI